MNIDNNKYECQIEFSNNGNAFVSIDGNEIFIHKKNTLNSLHLDKVFLNIFKRDNKIEGKVIEVVSRFRKEYVGRVHINKNTVFVIPDSNKIHVDFYIKGGLDVEQGQKVVVELIKWENTKSPQGKITRILGNSGENNAEINSIMIEYDLPVEFPIDVIEESKEIDTEISKEEIQYRRDLREITTFTIDPVDAKDFDDALSINILDDNNIEVGVHIADVSHYVKEGSRIDEEAYNRGTSVYLVDRVVPMLPERLSNNICSLVPNEDRLAFSVIFTLDKNGIIKKEWFGKTIIHSNKRFSYEDAQKIIEGEDLPFYREVRKLDELAKKIRKERIKRGSIEISGIEVKFILDNDNKKPIDIFFKEQKDSNKLIEEFMLLANKSVAKKLSNEGYNNVYRVHDIPNMEKLEELVVICKNLGYDINLYNNEDLKNTLNTLINDVDGMPEENMIETLITRSMSKAKYTIKNIGHYGLGFTYYSHFTSPIRRYPDLLTHRILYNSLTNKKNLNAVELEEKSKWCSNKEIASAKAQRDSIKYKQAEYLKDKVGQVFEGIVSGITEWGIYVELVDNKCEGMIKLNNTWKINTKNYTFSNSTTVNKLGDRIMVCIKSVDVEKKQINFSLFN